MCPLSVGPPPATTVRSLIDLAGHLYPCGVWVPLSLVGEHLQAGRLVQMLAEWSPNYSGLCLYYPANRHPPMALRLFVQAVQEWAGQARRDAQR